jgi:hypothetical protein
MGDDVKRGLGSLSGAEPSVRPEKYKSYQIMSLRGLPRACASRVDDSLIPDKQQGQPCVAALVIAVKLKTPSLYAAFAAGAGIFSGAGFSSNGVVFHFFSSGRTCFTKHRMLRSASSNGIPA